MPKRTNEKQEIIALLRRLLAREGCTISESRLLTDAVTGAEREVDIVMECLENDLSLVVSFEVLGKKRPANITWVEQQQKKHENLPTHRLVLVSWSGFTKNALEQLRRDPSVIPLTPQVVTGRDGTPEIRSLFLEEYSLTPRRIFLSVRRPEGSVRIRDDSQACQIFDPEGRDLGTVQALVAEFLNSPFARQKVSSELHSHPEREKVTWFVLGMNPLPDNLRLRNLPTGQLHPLTALEVQGELTWRQKRVDLKVATLGEIIFGHARVDVLGREGLLVATLEKGGSGFAKVTARLYPDGMPKAGNHE